MAGFPPKGIHVTALAGRRPFKWVVTVDGEVIARCPNDANAQFVRRGLVCLEAEKAEKHTRDELLSGRRGRKSASRRERGGGLTAEPSRQSTFEPYSEGICESCGEGYQPLDVNLECKRCADRRPNVGYNPLLSPMRRK